MHNKKAGIELSVNFLVVIIISVVLLGFGIKFAYDLVKGVENYQKNEEERVMKELESMLCESSDLVCVPFFSKEVEAGKPAVFGVKIVNVDSNQKTFRLDFYNDKDCFINKGNAKEGCASQFDLIFDGSDFTVEGKNSVSKLVIANIHNDAKGPGTYILNLEVKERIQPQDKTQDKTYGSKQKIYVKVA